MLLPSVGDTVNERYRIDAILARGGMGVVYRGTQLAMAREVAIKMVLAENQGSDRHLERFRREVQIAMRLNHPSVVEIYDFGQTSDGMNFIVMEFLEGQDLKAIINQQGAFKVGRARQILEHVLDALCTAHENNIIHRDLKPSNIMLTRVGRGRELPKILDFGIAKSVGEHTELTVSGEVLGSIPYLAPEGLRGEPSGFKVDVYAMGLIALEMLTGARVRQGNTAQIVAQHLTRDVEIPKEIQNTALATFIQRACDRDPRQRFPDAMVMYDALELAFKDIDPELVCEAPIVHMLEDPYAALVDEAPTTATPSGSVGFEEGRPTMVFAESVRADTGSLSADKLRDDIDFLALSDRENEHENEEENDRATKKNARILQPRMEPVTQSSSFETHPREIRRGPILIGAFLLGALSLTILFVSQMESGATQEDVGEVALTEQVEPAPIEIPDIEAQPAPEPSPELVVLDDKPIKSDIEDEPKTVDKKPALTTKRDDSASKKTKNRDTQRTTSRTQPEDDDPFSIRKF